MLAGLRSSDKWLNPKDRVGFLVLAVLFALTQKVAKKSRLHKNPLKSLWLQANDLNSPAEKAAFEQQIVHAHSFQKSLGYHHNCILLATFL